ncbi:MAG: prephenate dehydrogenase/arogenate dehydrogenase family protein [Deltaproteobacteria bacterium]|nr:prephenate dehydrogenase/arogenate dehydrogenase family protein [Deltaproteobacteria bacterium]
MEPYFKKLTIIGVGLIGGSLAMALRKKGMVGEIVGVGRSISNLELAVKLDVIDKFTTDPAAGVMGADLVVVATPVASMAEMMKKIAPYLKEGALVTDVGSVKGAVVKEAEKLIPSGVYFIGGHPIAGTEESGVCAAFPTLFEKNRCILTPTAKTEREALKKVKEIWEAAGSEVILMDAEKHDSILAAVSHLPHVIAYSLVNTVDDVKDFEESILSYSAGGFRDFTRIASSSPEMWRDICLLNRDAIIDMITRFEKSLTKLKGYIKESNGHEIFKEFDRSKKARDSIVKK